MLKRECMNGRRGGSRRTCFRVRMNRERSSTMRPMRPKSWARLAGVAAVFLAAMIFMSAGSAPAAADESRWGANYFPNVELTDQHGNKLHFYDDLLKGKIVVIEQFYTHCI